MQKNHDILSKPRAMLVGSFRGVKILLAKPLLRWYFAHGLVVDRVYQIIEYEPNPCFRRFEESVSTARRAGDEDPDKAIICRHDETTRPIRAMGRRSPTLIGIVMSSTAPISVPSALINNKRFSTNWMFVTEDAYEIEMNKSVVKYTLPLHIGFFVYQYAKTTHATVLLRLCRQIRRTTVVSVLRDEKQTRHTLHWLVKASMDSVRADRRAHYFRHRSQWLPGRML